MKLKRFLLSVLLTLGAAGAAWSVPADPAVKTVTQPDGTQLQVMQRGDEWRHMVLTSDGVPLWYNRTSGAFEYAAMQRGVFTGSGIVARNAGERDAQAMAYVATLNAQAMFDGSSTGLRKAAGQRKVRITNVPTTGHRNYLVVLWEFSDKNFESVDNPKQYFNDMLNKEGFTWSNGANGSARDFYLTSSAGNFDPEFVVAGPVKLSNTSTYYGSDEGGQDNNIAEAIEESLRALDSELDYSEFDTDGDGIVDNVYFFYAGNGQADTPDGSDLIWPHSWDIETGWKKTITLDGVKFGHYACSNEVRYSTVGAVNPTGIGTFVHEFAHVLGLADHYDVSYGLLTFGLGTWDTMASGSYNNNMNTPPTFSGFERAELGWMDYIDLDIDADSLNVLPDLQYNNVAYRVPVAGTGGNEFYVLENRQMTGWDTYLPGHGMLLWHIDMDSTVWHNNTVNVDAAHQRVDIVEVDGSSNDASRGGDIMPGTGSVTQWQLTSWAGDNLLKIDDVVETGDSVVMLLAGTAYSLPAPAAIGIETQDSSMVVTWDAVPYAQSYVLGIYTQDEQGGKTYLNGYNRVQRFNANPATVTGLLPGTQYYVELQAKQASYSSAWATASATTQELAFEKRQPVGLAANGVTPTGFTATWDAVPHATDYTTTLYSHAYGDALREQGYDFADKENGMPSLWSTSSTMYYSVKGYYGEAAPSLRLGQDQDYLVVAFPETLISTIKFWCRASKADNKIEVLVPDASGAWVTQTTLDAPTTARTLTATVPAASRVMLRLQRSSGYVVIDDVVASGNVIERTPVEPYVNKSTQGSTTQAYEGLAAGGTYSFRVWGVDQNGTTSYGSDELALTLPAKVDTIALGYSNGEIAASTTLQSTGTGWTEAAIRIPASAWSTYSGSAITSIKAGLVNRINCDTLTVWVRRSLDGDNLAQGTITRPGNPAIAKGWNEVELETPFSLEGSEGDIFVGYSLHHKANVNAVSLVEPAMGRTSYVKLAGTDSWSDVGASGVLSIEATVIGPTVPTYDLGIGATTISPNPSQGVHALTIEAVVTNYGSKPVTGFTLSASTPAVSSAITGKFDQEIASGATATVKFDVNPRKSTGAGDVWTVAVTQLEDGADEVAANNEATAVYTFLRTVLVEEFTTEQCINCPTAAAKLHEALSQPELAGRVAAVCHHSGYYTDKFTLECDNDYTWFYNNSGSMYAPAFMIDRDTEFSSSATTPVFNTPATAAQMVTLLSYEMEKPTNAMIGIAKEFNADSTQVTVTINGLRNDNYVTASPRVNVQLTEDEVATTDQVGASGTYYQQHLTRAYNSSWGEPVEWSADGTFTISCTFDLDSSWNKGNMNVVAWLYNYDSTNPANCKVDNAAVKGLLAADQQPATADVNGDGVVDASDVTAVIAAVLGNGGSADLNGDGVTDASDVTAVVAAVLGN